MLLDLKNNELIFSQIEKEDKKEFKLHLQQMKDVKPREYKDKYYIPLTHFYVVQNVLSKKYGKNLSISVSYMKFAERFVLDKNPVTIRWTPATCYITGRGIPWQEVIPLTSYFDKKSKNVKSYGKTWSGYQHLFNVTEGSFPSGLLERIIVLLNKYQVQYHVEKTFNYPKPYLHLHPVFTFEPTQDQLDATEILDKSNHGIAKLPTGFGKTSYVAASLIARKGVRSLFLANQRVLTDDAKSDFDSVFANDDIKIGMIGDGVYDPGDITVASIQTISASLKPPTAKEKQVAQYEYDLAKQRYEFAVDPEEKKVAEKEMKKYGNRVRSITNRQERHNKIIPFLKEIDLFIVDEAQVLGTDQWNDFLHACPAPYRYTLSATPTRTDGGGIQIIAATGDVRYESSASDQIEKGRLSEFLAHFVKFDHKMDRELMRELKMDYHQAYDVFIVRNELRNRHLCYQTKKWAQDFSVLALVTRKEHGEIIKNMLVELGMKEEEVHYVDGDTPKKVRKETIQDFRDSKFPVLIGTSIFDVGFNAKNASKIVRFNAGGSEVREPQRAGRTVRKREDGSMGESYDVIDVNVPFFESQGWKRRKLLQDEFGVERVKMTGKTIEGELNIVGLKEIVAAIPDETDKRKGEDIIRSLQFGEESYDEIPEVDIKKLEPDLQNLLSELAFPE